MHRSYGVILARHEPQETGLSVPYLMEAFDFNPAEERLGMCLDIVAEHRGRKPARYRVLHRGRTEAWMHGFTLDGADELTEALAEYYAREHTINDVPRRLFAESAEPGKVLFRRPVMTIVLSEEAVPVSILPGQNTEAVELRPEMETGPDQLLTSYVIPAEGQAPIEPGQIALCRLRVDLKPESYRSIIGHGDRLELESAVRHLDDIRASEPMGLKQDKTADEIKEFLRENVPRESLITPCYQDTLLLKSQVSVRPESFGACPMQRSYEIPRSKALIYRGGEDWFLEINPKEPENDASAMHDEAGCARE